MVTPAVVEAAKQLHPLRQQQVFFSRQNPIFANIDHLADTVRAKRAAIDADNPFVELERLYADCVEHAFNLYRDTRDAMIELTFYGLYATPWMKTLGISRKGRPRSHDISKFPHVQEAINRAKAGGYAEGIVRMLVLLARARSSVRRDRLERSD